jgi:protein-S-isoprenylcysteine O-methyltransferase Ste14
VRRGAARVLALLGASGALWWGAMAGVPAVRPFFVAADLPPRWLGTLAGADLPLFVGGALGSAWMLWRRPGSPWGERLVWLTLGATLYATLLVVGDTVRTDGATWPAAMGMCLASAVVSLVAWVIRPGGRLFEPSAPASRAAHLVRTAGYSAFFWGVFLGFAPWLLRVAERSLGVPPPPVASPQWLPWVILAPAAAVNLWSGAVMAIHGDGTPLPQDTARALVVRGPYRWVRNPMALSGVSLVVGVGWLLGSPSTIAAGLLGGLVWHVAARPPEERDLAERFGAAYRAYRASVPLWIPRLHPYVPPGSGSNRRT